MAEIVEQRVKPTLIRRRAKKEEAVDEVPPPAPLAGEQVAQSAPAVAPKVESVKSAVPPSVAPTGSPQQQQQQMRAQVGPSGKPYTGLIAPPPPGMAQKLAQAKQAQQTGTSTQSQLKTPLSTKELEDKFKKAPKKKLSRAEFYLEDIKRAGGLKHFAVETADEIKIDTTREKDRVFQPIHRKKKPVRREFQKTQITVPGAAKKNIRIAESITVSDLSQQMGIKASELIKKLMALDVMVTANQSIDIDMATLLAKDYGFEIEQVAFKEANVFEDVGKKRDKNFINRPPVVTVMGHVDHGKTSVLDYIRKTKVAAGEAGGITQHIGAYEVKTSKGSITFIDTPGHAAFTAMRARGAKVTDIVVLVVAADDGVMPQTKEAIDHAKAAGVPMIVAINKVDKPEANVERCKRSLSEYGVIPEEWGGETICVNTSAKSGQGIDQLLEMISLQAEVMELKSDAAAPAKGSIIEAKLDRGLGPVATVLVQSGTLKTGSFIVSGLYYGKVRTLINHVGEHVNEAGPSKAVSIIGLSGVPMAGDELQEAPDEKSARTVSEERQRKQRSENLAKNVKISLEDLSKQVAQGEVKELKIVLKADVHGSIEAIKDALPKLSTEKVKVSILHAGVGGVTESDVMLAVAGGAIVVGFNVVPETGVTGIAEREGVEIRRYSIIYDLMDEVRKSMEGLLAPLQVEKITGHAKVRQVFTISKVGTIAGTMVVDGKIVRAAGVRLIRDNKIIYTGKMESLKRFKDDAKEVNEGNDCGISIGYNDIKEGDVIEAFIIEQIAQTL